MSCQETIMNRRKLPAAHYRRVLLRIATAALLLPLLAFADQGDRRDWHGH